MKSPLTIEADDKMESILSHPLVYKDLTSLVVDLRFKSFLNLELRNVFDQRGDLINSFADIRWNEKCIFLTDDKTLQVKGKELFIFLTCFHTKMYLKEIIPINILENFRNDGTQILEIEDVYIEGCDLDDGKPPREGGELDPIKLMKEKLELIRILKKPQRLRLIKPMPTLPEIPKKMAPHLTQAMKGMFSKSTNQNSLIKSKIQLDKARNLHNFQVENEKICRTHRKTNSVDFTFPRHLNTSILDLKYQGLQRLKDIEEAEVKMYKQSILATGQNYDQNIFNTPNDHNQQYDMGTYSKSNFPLLTNSKIMHSIASARMIPTIESQKMAFTAGNPLDDKLRNRKLSALRVEDKSLMPQTKRNMRYLDQLEHKTNNSRDIGMTWH